MIHVPHGSSLMQLLKGCCPCHKLKDWAPQSSCSVRLWPQFEYLIDVTGLNTSALKDEGESLCRPLVQCISLSHVANRISPQ